ncbi:helix-turn-helix transcriptional regulator [Kitasatospora sp. NPDC001603]|uniref:helix-turn-helix transcriptional regulator n=1 Tax=Kitasatospora sp. NPDC001603 TaxID=3154388 RepID=UPI00332BA5CB
MLLLDDLQRASRGTLAVLAGLKGPVVGTYCTPVHPEHTGLEHLARTVIALRPLARTDSERLLAAMIEATPTPELVDALHHCSRGRPSLLRLAVDAHRTGGSLRILDGTAYLAGTGTFSAPAPNHPVIQRLRLLGRAEWDVLKALTVLHPLGPAAEQVVADRLELSAADLWKVLARLSPHITRTAGTWRFRAPVIEHCVREQLGPWERQDLSRSAVIALWGETAACSAPSYLPERLVDAGRLVDTGRAGNELLEAGRAAMVDDRSHAQRWLRAAARSHNDPATRATALALHAVVCGSRHDHRLAVESTGHVLRQCAHLISPDLLQEVQVTRLVALAANRETAALHAIAEHRSGALPGSDGCRAVTAAIALSLVGQWAQASRMLANTRSAWSSANNTTATYGELLHVETAVLSGRMAGLDRLENDPELLPLFREPRHRLTTLAHLARILIGLGETARAEHLLSRHDGHSIPVSDADSALIGLRTGQWRPALRQSRLALADSVSVGQPIPHTALIHETTMALAAGGWLRRAQAVIEQGRTNQAAVPYVLDLAEAELALVINHRERARHLLEHGLSSAARQNLMMTTDDMWLRILLLCPGKSHTALAELKRIANRMGTGRTRRNYLLGRAIVCKDRGDHAVKVAKDRGQPAEVAETLELVALHVGWGNTRLLREAYEIYGHLDALLPRARLRRLMAKQSIPVPGRAATVAETERLLATLVSEGLTNRELARVLQTTEKSVESRLTRLFQRAGYRSRVELAAAMMTGRYPGAPQPHT